MLKQRLAIWFAPAADSGVAGDIRCGKNPHADNIHLLWSIWIFITPLFDHGLAGYTRRWMLFTLFSYPLFLFLFLMVQRVSRRHLGWFPLGMIALCLASLPWYPSGVSYLVFGCIMLRHCMVSWRRYLLALLSINAAFVVLAWRVGYPLALLVIMPGTIFIICAIVAVEYANKEKDAALRLSQDEVRQLAATAERERIGRDLHDLLGHTLSLITLKLELSRKLFDRDIEAARREVIDAEAVAREALAEVRAAVSGIRATDIAVELAAARLMLESSSVHLQYDAPPPLPAEVARTLALILREAVTNISRHAGASTARIGFENTTAGVQLRVADNGRGGAVEDGNGLRGMRERVAAIGGRLMLESPKGQGTTLLVTVPLAAQQRIDGLNRATTSQHVRPSQPGAGVGAGDDAQSMLIEGHL